MLLLFLHYHNNLGIGIKTATDQSCWNSFAMLGKKEKSLHYLIWLASDWVFLCAFFFINSTSKKSWLMLTEY